MNCNEFCERLSDFVDAELPEELEGDFTEHLDGCADCSAKLRQFRLLSHLMQPSSSDCHSKPVTIDALEEPTAERMWAAIAQGLDAHESSASIAATSLSLELSEQRELRRLELKPFDRRWRSGAIAALLAIAGMGLWFLPGVVTTWRNNSMDASGAATSLNSVDSATTANVVIDFQNLLATEFQPREALAALSQQFRGKETPPADAQALLGYQPSMAKELPGGMQLVSLQVLKLPHCNCPAGKCTCGPGGCNCSASLCQRGDGTDLLVVEHCESQPISFGDLPSKLVRRSEHEFYFLKTGKQYAATWTANQRRLTAIGVNDLEEAALLIADASHVR